MTITAERWSEADDAAIMELYSTCTIKQMAKYTGRTPGAVVGRMHRLRRDGLINTKAPGRIMNAFSIPSKSILLAKTCPRCGDLLSTEHYRRKRNGAYMAWCIKCVNKHGEKRDRKNTGRQFWDIAQKVSKQTAANHGNEWTNHELDIVDDDKKSNLELAITLGRTYSSICSIRTKRGIKRNNLDNFGPWLIHFPNALKVLRQEYIRLGIPDDGWDA